jgi:hypothetical protein
LGTRLMRGGLVRDKGGEHKGVGESSTNTSPRGVEPRCRRETALGDSQEEEDRTGSGEAGERRRDGPVAGW